MKALLLTYVFFLPFVRLWFLPIVDAKLQPTELIFIPLFVLAIREFGWELVALPRAVLVVFAAYLVTNFLSAGISGDYRAMLEAVGRVYLVALALIFRVGVQRWGSEALWRWFTYGILVFAATSYGGYALALMGFDNRMVQLYGNYPYFGDVLRAAGFTGGGGMLILVLWLPILYGWYRGRRGQRHWLYLVLALLPLAFLTWAKELLLLALGMVLLDPWWARGRGGRGSSLLRVGLITVVSLLFWFGTHLIVQTSQRGGENELTGTPYTSERILLRVQGYQLLETSYLSLKRAALSVWFKHPWTGVGPGQFNAALPAEQSAGNYPDHLPLYDPHSTWLGALAETGLAGFAALFAMVTVLTDLFLRRLPKSLEDSVPGQATVSVVAVFFLLCLLLSVSKDVLNFRFLWFAVGLLLGGLGKYPLPLPLRPRPQRTFVA